MLVAAPGTAATARSVTAEAASLTLGDAWFVSLARAESLMCAASARGEVDSTDRAAVAEQIRLGVHFLGSVIQASVVADTVLAEPLATVPPPEPPARGWKYRVFKATGVISAVTSLVHLAATLSGASPQTRSVLGYVGGAAGGVSGVFNRLMARPASRPATDPIERMQTLDLETDLRDSIHETEFAAELLWVELRGMALDSCATDEQAVWLARRYANALQGTSVIIDTRMATSLAIALSCAQHPGFAAESRERCGALASHLDAVGELWQKRRWLFERSKRNTLDYLVLADRP